MCPWQEESKQRTYEKFAKVGCLVYLLQKVTKKRTFENLETIELCKNGEVA